MQTHYEITVSGQFTPSIETIDRSTSPQIMADKFDKIKRQRTYKYRELKLTRVTINPESWVVDPILTKPKSL